LVCAGILAAAISSSDSYLLISASAVSKNVWQGLIHKNASDREVMVVSRIVLVLITIFAVFVATGNNQIIFSIVDFAWAGWRGLRTSDDLSLFWKRTTYAGAIAGMVCGGAWCLSGTSGYPSSAAHGAFMSASRVRILLLVIVVVSLLTEKPAGKFRMSSTA
jgi:sodium/proline symporter